MNNQFGYPQPVMPQNNMGYPMYNGLPINQPVYRTQVPQVQPMQMQPSYSVIPGRIVNTPDEIRPNEVPNDGSIAVFPLNDGSAVYLKYFTGEGRIKLRCCGPYEVRFTGNIGTSGDAGTAQLSIAMGGVTYPPSTIISETATAGTLNAVERTFYLANCCGDYDRLTVTNTGTTALTIGANAIFSARLVKC